jgi:hypothetical protein
MNTAGRCELSARNVPTQDLALPLSISNPGLIGEVFCSGVSAPKSRDE